MIRPMKRNISILALFVALVPFATNILAQDTISVTGIVKSSLKMPASNVSVSVEGSTMLPVVTDSTGAFTLQAVSGNEWLIVSPTGDLKMRRIFLNKRTDLTIYLNSEERISGDDPMVILDQTYLRRDMVSAFAEPDLSERHHNSAFTVDEYMEGNVSGMYTVNRTGDIGSGAVPTLRGVRSVYATNQPLYIVDGTPVGTVASYTFSDVSTDHVIDVYFSKKT